MTTTTLKQAKEQLAALSMTISKRDGEYRVAFTRQQGDAHTYYTNDIDDAIATAKSMRAEVTAQMNRAKAKLLASSVESTSDAQRYTADALQSADDRELIERESEARDKHAACDVLLGVDHAATRLWWHRVNKVRLVRLGRASSTSTTTQLDDDIRSQMHALRTVAIRDLSVLHAMLFTLPVASREYDALSSIIAHAETIETLQRCKTSAAGKRAIMSIGAVRRAQQS